jgi:hypothetical protein
MKPSQNNLILKALKRGAKLTPIDALARFGCFRLSARILDLKAAGHNIKTKIIKSANGKRFAQYSLPRKRKGKT